MASSEEQIGGLNDILDRLEASAEKQSSVTLGEMLKMVGQRSFAPILLTVGLLTVSPLSGIPGMPTTIGILVFLISVQLLSGRDHFWLPQWVLSRHIQGRKLAKAVEVLRRPSTVIDRRLRPRLTFLTGHVGAYSIIALCSLLAVSMPPLELLPFVATGAGLAFCSFALALLSHDGLFALLGLALTCILIGVVVYGLQAL